MSQSLRALEPDFIWQLVTRSSGLVHEERKANREQRPSMLQSRKRMAQIPATPTNGEAQTLLYCPKCAREVSDPLTCGDCSAVICRVCGTPLEVPEDLGIG
jgi:hypothetical protein